ncbi:DNA-binding transcriptional ArsR family regulator [Bradyrhizobium sp. S3.2.6]|uniref:ArsR/SmtB family transcription factor n=1 Tax=Bradyrhizobium sp. S3.2.6 TaxID=3156428 RepID=UPI003397DA65
MTEVFVLGTASLSAYEKGMDTGPKIAQVAALIGDPARANMLSALMDGRTLTASELAYVSGVAPQTASGHLAKLSDAGLLALAKRGRRRYFRLASPHVARVLEGLMVVAQDGPARQRNLWRGGETLRHARTCYDHMAGRIAVAIADRLVQQSFILLDEDGGQLTDAGRSFFNELGVDLCLASKRRVFCRPCLDWSERRPHLAGAVGAAILDHALEHDWVEHVRDSRALVVTPVGVRELATTFGIEGAPPMDGHDGRVGSLSGGRVSAIAVESAPPGRR